MKRFTIVILFFLFFLPLHSQKKEQKEEIIKIPKQVAQLMDLNIFERKKRIDIPIEFKNYYFFPGVRDNLFVVIFFTLRNDALFTSEVEDKMIGELDLFMRFYSLDDKGIPKKSVKEFYLPLQAIVEKEKYNPEEAHYYSIVQTISPGKYILAYSLATPDLKKISLAFEELSLPDPAKIENLMTTPLFFVKTLKILETATTEARIQRDGFTFGRLEIEPYFTNNFRGNEILELFYFILGASTSSRGTYDFEINYKLMKGKEEKVKFAPQILKNQRAPLVSHPIPIFDKETKLEPGEYNLLISINDKNSGKSFEGKLDFQVE